MSTARRRYLLSYDIADDKRRATVFKTLRDVGDHAQYSVFFSELNARELVTLRGRLETMLHHGEDQLLILDLGPASRDLMSLLDVIGKPHEPKIRCLVV